MSDTLVPSRYPEPNPLPATLICQNGHTTGFPVALGAKGERLCPTCGLELFVRKPAPPAPPKKGEAVKAAYEVLTRSLQDAIDNARSGYIKVSTIRRALAKAEARKAKP